MCALPAATHSKADTLVGRQSIIVFTPTGGAATNLLVDIVDLDAILEILRSMAPGASNAPAFAQRTWANSRTEMVKAETNEIGKVNSLLTGLSGLVEGTCTVWIRDPKDAANKVAFKSDEFSCTLYRDQTSLRLSGAAASRTFLIFESNKDGPITWTKDFDYSA